MDRADIPPVAAFISAGWSPSEKDPLAAYTGGGPKALIPILGRPMIAYVVDALVYSRYLRHLVIVGLDPAIGLTAPFPIDYLPSAGGILENSEAGLRYIVTHYPEVGAVLACTSDIPCLQPEMVDLFVETCLESDHDVYYSIVERSVMEGRFPGSRRSFVHMREGHFAGGDLMMARPRMLDKMDLDFARALTRERKRAWKQVRLVGLGTLLRFVLGRLSLAEAEQCAGRVLKVTGRAVPFPHAEIGMDVDKPLQLEIVRADMERRLGRPAPVEVEAAEAEATVEVEQTA